MDNEENFIVKDTTFEYLWKDEVTAKVTFNLATEKIEVENWDGDLLRTPFGYNKEVTIKDLSRFLEDRCVPRTRVNIQDFLDYYKHMYYEPYAIVRLTHGVMMEDLYWIRFEGEEDLTFMDVRPDLRMGI